jgi:uncharacterized protein YbaR (Trm112 family)
MFEFILNLFRLSKLFESNQLPESYDSFVCFICYNKTNKPSKSLTCHHKYGKECIETLQTYKQGDFVETFKHECPECREPLQMSNDKYHIQIKKDGTFNLKYDDKHYYRFCMTCSKLINVGDKSCQTEKKGLLEYCMDCDPNIRNRVCRCGYTLEWSSGCTKVTCPKCNVNLCFIHDKTEKEIRDEISRLKSSKLSNDKKLYKKITNNVGGLYINYISSSIIYACPWCHNDNTTIIDTRSDSKKAQKIIMESNKHKYYSQAVYV